MPDAVPTETIQIEDPNLPGPPQPPVPFHGQHSSMWSFLLSVSSLVGVVVGSAQVEERRAFMAELPDPEHVFAAVRGDGEVDTAARQHAALVLMLALVTGQGDETNQQPYPEDVRRHYFEYVNALDGVREQHGDSFWDIVAVSQRLQAKPGFLDALAAQFFSPQARADCAPFVEYLHASAKRSIASSPEPMGDSQPAPLLDALGGPYVPVAVVSGGIALWTLLLLLGTLRPSRLTTIDGRTWLQVAHRRFRLSAVVGSVMGADRQQEVHHVSGSETRDADGRLVSSTAGYTFQVVKDRMIVRGDDGKEHAIRLNDWDVVARPGHRIAVIALIERSRDSGYYVLYHNADLRETSTNHAALRPSLRVGRRLRFVFMLSVVITIGALLLQQRPDPNVSDLQEVAQTLGLIVLLTWIATWIYSSIRMYFAVRTFDRDIAPAAISAVMTPAHAE